MSNKSVQELLNEAAGTGNMSAQEVLASVAETGFGGVRRVSVGEDLQAVIDAAAGKYQIGSRRTFIGFTSAPAAGTTVVITSYDANGEVLETQPIAFGTDVTSYNVDTVAGKTATAIATSDSVTATATGGLKTAMVSVDEAATDVAYFAVTTTSAAVVLYDIERIYSADMPAITFLLAEGLYKGIIYVPDNCTMMSVGGVATIQPPDYYPSMGVLWDKCVYLGPGATLERVNVFASAEYDELNRLHAAVGLRDGVTVHQCHLKGVSFCGMYCSEELPTRYIRITNNRLDSSNPLNLCGTDGILIAHNTGGVEGNLGGLCWGYLDDISNTFIDGLPGVGARILNNHFRAVNTTGTADVTPYGIKMSGHGVTIKGNVIVLIDYNATGVGPGNDSLVLITRANLRDGETVYQDNYIEENTFVMGRFAASDGAPLSTGSMDAFTFGNNSDPIAGARLSNNRVDLLSPASVYLVNAIQSVENDDAYIVLGPSAMAGADGDVLSSGIDVIGNPTGSGANLLGPTLDTAFAGGASANRAKLAGWFKGIYTNTGDSNKKYVCTTDGTNWYTALLTTAAES